MAHPRAHGGGDVRQRAEGVRVLIDGGLGRLKIEVAHGELFKVVAPVSGGEQVGGHGGVEHEAVGGKSLLQQAAHKGLAVMGDLFDVPGEKAPEKFVVAVQPVRKEQGGPAVVPLAELHAYAVQVGQGEEGNVLPAPEDVQQLAHPFSTVHDLAFAGASEFLLRLLHGAVAGQAQLVDELGKLQPQQNVVQRAVVPRLPDGVSGGEVHGRVPADGGQIVAHPGVRLALGELADGGGLGVDVWQPVVNDVDGGILLDEGHGGLFAHALHAGDVVRSVPHEGLQVDDVDGVEAVLLPEGVWGHIFRGGLAHAGGDQLDGGVPVDELEGVLVAGDHHGGAAALTVDPGHGAQQVVGLPALQLVPADVHGVQHLFQHRHLGGQLLGHALALGLVALVDQMAEGGGLQIEGHGQPLGLFLVQQLEENVQKAENGVGGQPVPGGQVLAHAVKGAVDDGVAVDDHELHGRSLAFLRCCRYSIPKNTV